MPGDARPPFSDYIVYVDESGDHSLTSIDPDYPVFVLAFCLFRKAEYYEEVSPAVGRLKFEFFGHDQVILHERDIRKETGPFAFLRRDRIMRDLFHGRLTDMIEAAPFTVIAAVINKRDHVARYNQPISPYDLALTFCMERLAMCLNERGVTGRTHVIVERRGEKEDKDLELVFRRVVAGANRLEEVLPFEVVFAPKGSNSSGLQFSDLIARPIGIHELRPDQENRAHEVIQRKFRRKPGTQQVSGYGLKVFP